MLFSRASLSLICLSAMFACACSDTRADDDRIAASRVSTSIALPTIASSSRAFRRDGELLRSVGASYVAQTTALGFSVAPIATRVGAPAVFELASLGRDGAPAVAAVRPEIARDGALTFARADVVERIAHDESDAIAQSWAFDRKPDGAGDLVVRVRVAGERFDRATANGLHFTDDATRLGLRYGNGTWIDARGVRIAIPATWEDGAIALRVPAAIVESSAYPAVLDPIVSAEIATDTPVSVASGGSTSKTPQIAVAGDTALVVWAEEYGVIGARLRVSDGALLGAPITIGTGETNAFDPGVATDGTDFFVAWIDPRNDLWNIYGAKVAANGTVAQPILVSLGSGNSEIQLEPTVAYGGGNYLVTWTRSANSDSDAVGALVTQSGSLVGSPSTPIAIATGSGARGVPRAAFGAGSFLVAYATLAQIHAKVLSTQGALVGNVATDNGVTVSSGLDDTAPAVASDGTGFFVAWTDAINAGALPSGVRVTTTPSLAVVGSPVALGVQGDNVSSAASNGSDRYAVAISHGYGQDVSAVFVAANGTTSTSAVSTAPNAQRAPAIAFDGTSFFLAWSDERRHPNIYDVYAAQITSGGALVGAGAPPATGGTLLTLGPQTEMSPASAFDGADTYLVVWEDTRGEGVDVYGVRIRKSDGAVLDPNGIAIATGADNQATPSVAYGGGTFVVAWSDSDGPPMTRLTARAATVNPQTGAVGAANDIAPYSTPGGMVFDGTNFFVTLAYEHIINGVFVSTTAQALGDPSVLCDVGGQTNPRVAFDGAHFFVVFEDNRAHDASNVDVYGVLATPAGTPVGGTSGIPIATTHGSSQSRPSVAAGGGHFFVVWSEGASGFYPSLAGAFVGANGTLISPLDGIPVSTRGENATASAVSFNGKNFLVAWSARATGAYDQHVYGARIAPDGTFLDGAPGVGGFDISVDPTDGSSLAIASGNDGVSLVTYGLLAPSSQRERGRAHSRIVTDDAASPPDAGGGSDAGADASHSDAGGGADAGADASAHSDASAAGDASTSNETPGASDGGCGCRVADHSPDSRGALGAMAIALLLAARRRRRLS